mmetsp:Transcript_70120/g.131079  ORF Transcript_70120/g.131079 Transcript_70120/m.131079 type:complete len:277 (-) Transcript_70120:18-848(-)
MPAVEPECPACNGTGTQNSSRLVPCENCDGEGSCEAGPRRRVNCPICDGEGRVPTKEPCSECRGVGRLPKVSQAAKASPAPKRRAKAKASPEVVGRPTTEPPTNEGQVEVSRSKSPATSASLAARQSPDAPAQERHVAAAEPAQTRQASGPPKKQEAASGKANDIEQQAAHAEKQADQEQEYYEDYPPKRTKKRGQPRIEITVNWNWCRWFGTFFSGVFFVFGFVLCLRGDGIIMYLIGACLSFGSGGALLQINMQRIRDMLQTWQDAAAAGRAAS